MVEEFKIFVPFIIDSQSDFPDISNMEITLTFYVLLLNI